MNPPSASPMLRSDHLHLETIEAVMRELLAAAVRPGPVPLSPLAREVLAELHCPLPDEAANWPAFYCRSARALREHCIRMGRSRRHYLSSTWVRSGL